MATATMNTQVIDESEPKSNSAINVLVDTKDKIEATKILKECGISMSSFISMALKQVIRVQGLPFEVTTREYYSKDLIEAIEEADQIVKEIKEGKRKGFNNVDEMFEEILKDE